MAGGVSTEAVGSGGTCPAIASSATKTASMTTITLVTSATMLFKALRSVLTLQNYTVLYCFVSDVAMLVVTVIYMIDSMYM